jgi:hypothetical protein
MVLLVRGNPPQGVLRRGPSMRSVAGYAAAILVLLAGILHLRAAIYRWWGHGDPDLSRVVNNSAYLIPKSADGADWQPFGSSPELYGFGLILVAVAISLVAFVALRRPGQPSGWRSDQVGLTTARVLMALTVLASGTLVLTGLHTLASGLADQPAAFVPEVYLGSAHWATVFWPIALLVVAHRLGRAWVLAAIGLFATMPYPSMVVGYIATIGLNSSQVWDVNPWSEGFVALVTMATAGVIVAATRKGVDDVDHPAVRIGVIAQNNQP